MFIRLGGLMLGPIREAHLVCDDDCPDVFPFSWIMKLVAGFAMSRMAGATQVVYLQFGKGNESVSSLVLDCVSKLLIRCRINVFS